MEYRTEYLKAASVEELAQAMAEFFEDNHDSTASMVINNIAYMQEMKVPMMPTHISGMPPPVPKMEFCCIITYTP